MKKIFITISIFIFILCSFKIIGASNKNNKSFSNDQNKVFIPNNSIFKLSLIEVDGLNEEVTNLESLLINATGFVIDYNPITEESFLISNDHFCKEYHNLSRPLIVAQNEEKVRLNDLSIFEADIFLDIIYQDELKDICILSTNEKLNPLPLESYDYNSDNGEVVYIIGGPLGVFPTVSEGIITIPKIDRTSVSPLDIGISDGEDFIYLSADLYPGSSGSPVINSQGNVIGMIFATIGVRGAAAIHINDIINTANEI